MSFNTIMVQLHLDGAAESQLEFAYGLAHQFDADLIAFAAAETRMIVSAGDSGIVAAEALRLQVEEIEARLKVVEGVFHRVTADSPRASWRGYLGDPTRLLSLHARAADPGRSVHEPVGFWRADFRAAAKRWLSRRMLRRRHYRQQSRSVSGSSIQLEIDALA